MTTTDNRTRNHQQAPPGPAGRAAAKSAPDPMVVKTYQAPPAAYRAPVTGPVGAPVGGPVPLPWREGTLTRAKELECLAYGLTRADGSPFTADLLAAIDQHLAAARQAAKHTKHNLGRRMDDALLERAISNLDAAHADLLQLAPASYVLGQIPSLLNEVQRHLPRHDPRRQEFERIASQLGVHPPERAPAPGTPPLTADEKLIIVESERSRIVSIARGANSAGLREQLRVRSFRTVLMVSSGVMTLLAVLLGLLGWLSPATLPLCFQPEQGGQIVVICPTGQSSALASVPAGTAAQPQIDAVVRRTVRPADIAVVEVIGLIAASVASAVALRRIRGSSEPHGLPVALALLKLPIGALTAVLGLMLMRGEFLPGLSALDTSGQIMAWAIVFGYAQQLFTRFVDQQADSVLSEVRGSRTVGDPPPG
jgi:hypothetical protein